MIKMPKDVPGEKLHTQEECWVIIGLSVCRNDLWIKDTDDSASGNFSIRDYEDKSVP